MWYHISVQGNGRQILFWDRQDILHAIDLLAVCSHNCQVDVLAYQFLSNHYHFILECDAPSAFMQSFRISYSKYFNNRHRSSGAVGKFRYSCGKITDCLRLENRLVYVLRNSAKHGVIEHPLMDPYNSSQYYFFNECKVTEPFNLKIAGPNNNLKNSGHLIPEHFRLDVKDHIYPRSFLKYHAVEQVFKSYSAFMRQLTNPTAEEIADNQGVTPNRRATTVTDLLLSEKILNSIKPRHISSLTVAEILQLCLKLLEKQTIPVRQLSRVFGIPETTLRRELQFLAR